MSARLEVLLDDPELEEIRQIARRHGMTVTDWVRQALEIARRREVRSDSKRKLEAVRAAAQHSFPTADIEQMLSEIEQGYLGDWPR